MGSCLIILDENILDGQRVLLEAWRLAPRQVGFNLAHKVTDPRGRVGESQIPYNSISN